MLRDLGDRTLEPRETDRTLFSDRFRNHDADSLCPVLDGTQREGGAAVFWNFPADLCRNMALTVYDRKTQCAEDE